MGMPATLGHNIEQQGQKKVEQRRADRQTETQGWACQARQGHTIEEQTQNKGEQSNAEQAGKAGKAGCRPSWQTCNSLHSTLTISSALADSADAKMLKMPVSLYRLLMAVQLTIQGNWFSTRVYNRECMPLPAPTMQN